MRHLDGIPTDDVPHQLSLSAVLLTPTFRSKGGAGDVPHAKATGFLIQIGERIFLVSARHVFTGKSVPPPGSGEVERDLTGGLPPSYLSVLCPNPVYGAGQALDFAEADAVAITHQTPLPLHLPLYFDLDDTSPRYRVNPDPEIDVAVIELDVGEANALKWVHRYVPGSWPTAEDLGDSSDTLLLLRILDRVFIIGFPYGDDRAWPTAVWTSGIVASEPGQGLAGKAGMLVDARSRQGQSGAPVVLLTRSEDPVRLADDNVLVDGRSVNALVGVYCGRRTMDSDLGLVWTFPAILGCILETPGHMGSMGDRPLDPGDHELG